MRHFTLSKGQILIFITLIIAGVVSAVTISKLNSSKNSADELIGKEFSSNTPLPEISLLEYKTKNACDQQLRQGKVLLVYLLSSCYGCQKESAVLAESDLLKGETVKVYGIADESEENLMSFARMHNFKFPILLDRESKFRKSLNINYFPANFVINNGIIVKSWFGNPRDKEDLYRKLEIIK